MQNPTAVLANNNNTTSSDHSNSSRSNSEFELVSASSHISSQSMNNNNTHSRTTPASSFGVINSDDLQNNGGSPAMSENRNLGNNAISIANPLPIHMTELQQIQVSNQTLAKENEALRHQLEEAKRSKDASEKEKQELVQQLKKNCSVMSKMLASQVEAKKEQKSAENKAGAQGTDNRVQSIWYEQSTSASIHPESEHVQSQQFGMIQQETVPTTLDWTQVIAHLENNKRDLLVHLPSHQVIGTDKFLHTLIVGLHKESFGCRPTHNGAAICIILVPNLEIKDAYMNLIRRESRVNYLEHDDKGISFRVKSSFNPIVCAVTCSGLLETLKPPRNYLNLDNLRFLLLHGANLLVKDPLFGRCIQQIKAHSKNYRVFTFTTKHDDNHIEMALALSEVMRGNYAQLRIGAPPPPPTTTNGGNEQQIRSMWEEEDEPDDNANQNCTEARIIDIGISAPSANGTGADGQALKRKHTKPGSILSETSECSSFSEDSSNMNDLLFRSERATLRAMLHPEGVELMDAGAGSVPSSNIGIGSHTRTLNTSTGNKPVVLQSIHQGLPEASPRSHTISDIWRETDSEEEDGANIQGRGSSTDEGGNGTPIRHNMWAEEEEEEEVQMAPAAVQPVPLPRQFRNLWSEDEEESSEDGNDQTLVRLQDTTGQSAQGANNSSSGNSNNLFVLSSMGSQTPEFGQNAIVDFLGGNNNGQQSSSSDYVPQTSQLKNFTNIGQSSGQNAPANQPRSRFLESISGNQPQQCQQPVDSNTTYEVYESCLESLDGQTTRSPTPTGSLSTSTTSSNSSDSNSREVSHATNSVPTGGARTFSVVSQRGSSSIHSPPSSMVSSQAAAPTAQNALRTASDNGSEIANVQRQIGVLHRQLNVLHNLIESLDGARNQMNFQMGNMRAEWFTQRQDLNMRLCQLEDQRDHNRVARDDMLLDMDIRLDTLEERLSGLNVEELINTSTHIDYLADDSVDMRLQLQRLTQRVDRIERITQSDTFRKAFLLEYANTLGVRNSSGQLILEDHFLYSDMFKQLIFNGGALGFRGIVLNTWIQNCPNTFMEQIIQHLRGSPTTADMVPQLVLKFPPSSFWEACTAWPASLLDTAFDRGATSRGSDASLGSIEERAIRSDKVLYKIRNGRTNAKFGLELQFEGAYIYQRVSRFSLRRLHP